MLQALVGIVVPIPVWPMLNVRALQASLTSTYTIEQEVYNHIFVAIRKNIRIFCSDVELPV